MQEATVYNVFKKMINGDEIILGAGRVVSVSKFTELFSGASDAPTYDELVAIDGGIMGYIPFFDRCKDEGILS